MTPTTPLTIHGACGKGWTGARRSHCPACHETFSSESAADRHRVGKHGVDRRCVDPATVGLVAREQPWGTCWGLPGDPNRTWPDHDHTPADEPDDAYAFAAASLGLETPATDQ